MTPPKKLYKYESWNDHSIANLKNQKLYFSDPRSFNDPFDCSVDYILSDVSDEAFSLWHAQYLNECPDKAGFVKQFGHTLTDEFKDYITPLIDKMFRKTTDRAFEKAGVSCFSEVKDEILMWSHYSASHTGFCLEFDTASEPLTKIFKVEYEDSFPKINSVKAIINNDASEILKPSLTKYTSWQYEREWRCFHESKNLLFGYPAEALTAVYFGTKMISAHIEIIALILNGQNPQVKLYRGKKSTTKFKVEFDEFQYTSYIEAKRKGLA